MLLALLRLGRLRAGAEVLVDPHWLTALAAAQRRYGLKGGAALLVSRDLRSPVSWGLLQPVIMLDARTAAEGAEAEAVVAHELAHIARGDWAKLMLGAVATALVWFNPLVWMLVRRCHDLREEAADDAVLRGGIACADYAGLLVRVARHDDVARRFAAHGVAGRGSLGRRILRVLDPERRGAPAPLGWSVGCGAVALAIGLSVAPVASSEPASAARETPAVGLAHAIGAFAGNTGRPASMQAIDASGHAPASMSDVGAGDDDAQTRAAPNTIEPAAIPPPASSTVLGRVLEAPVLDAALVEAARRGDLDAVNRLLDAGVDPDAVVKGQGTALMAAGRAGRTEVMRRLLDQGADANAREGGRTPLMAARQGGHRGVERLLLESGATR